jgi:phage/plasmid primase-like uncharacterized protein
MNIINAAQAACSRVGIVYQDVPHDGKFHPTAVSGKPTNNSSGRIKFFTDGEGGAVWNWISRETCCFWTETGTQGPTTAEIEARRLRAAEEQVKFQQEQQEMENRQATRARSIYEAAAPATADHPVFSRKKIFPPQGVRVGAWPQRGIENCLLAPLYNEHGELRNVQAIFPEVNPELGRDKDFLYGAQKKGCYFIIGEISDIAIICEGVATGMTIFQAVGRAVVCAFDAGNMIQVAQNIRSNFPKTDIIVAADDDHYTAGNPGIAKATEAARTVAGKVAVPKFPAARGAKDSDFNDLARLTGINSVRQIIDDAIADHGGDAKQDVHQDAPLHDLHVWSADRYRGEPPPVDYLVEGGFSLGKPSLYAAMGGAGKGYSILDLALKVATDQYKNSFCEAFGGRVMTGGSAVIFAAEDCRDEIHRRLNTLDPDGRRFDYPDRLIVVPFPDAGGCPSFMQQCRGGKLEMTDEFKRICDNLAKIDRLKMIAFDPISPMFPFDLSKPEYGQAAATPFCTLAAGTGAAVIATHHMRKNGDITNIAEAREAIRGSSSLVDGLRLAYAMWPEKEDNARKLCKKLGEDYEQMKVILGAVVKKNGPERMDITTYIRNSVGLLEDRTRQCHAQLTTSDEIKTALINTIAEAAIAGNPFTHTGINGVGQRINELPEKFRGMGRIRLESIVRELLDTGRVLKCPVKGNAVRWLDVPNGPVAQGSEECTTGKAVRKAQQ